MRGRLIFQKGGRTADAWILSDKPVVADHAAAGARSHHHQPGHRSAAKPRRGQPVLAWPLRRARRGDAASGARFDQPRGRHYDLRRKRSQRRIAGLLRSWDALPEDMLNVTPALVALAALATARPNRRAAQVAGAAQSSASAIRDRFRGAWRALTDLSELIKPPFDQGPSESAIFDPHQ